MGESENRWEGKPFRAFVIRAFAFLAPVAAALFVAWWLSNVIPRPSGWGLFALWWLSILVISTVVLRVTERFARKLLPLAALLKLTLVFPDRAPDRFTMSMRTGGAETLEEMAEQAQAASDEDDFATAAETILALAARLNSHDPRTRGHAERVRAYADMIAEEMGFDDEDRNKVKWACMLHDIGKLKVPLEIINKPGRLTDDEYDVIKNHPTWGMELSEPLLPWLGEFASGIGQHHERFDGFGYPNGISGTEIGLAGRIAAVADTFDVITSVRSYKQARPASEAREELARCAGSQFDPEVVRAFLNIGLGRQRWVAGPLSWLGQIPMVQSAVQGFTTLATNAGAVASTAATATALGAAAIVAPNMFPAAPALVELPATAIVVAADDFGRVDENGVITLDSLGNDQGDIASSRVITDPVNGTAQILNNQIVYTPNPGFSGTDSVEYEICNDQGECDTAIVTITVDAANKAPVQIGSTAVGVEDETLLIDPTTLVSDPEGDLDRSSLRVIGAPGSGVATVTAAGEIRYVPGPDFNGTDTITYEICDTQGLCLTETVIVTIEPANDLPEVSVAPVSGVEDSPVFIGVDAVDPDGDPVSTFVDSPPANGSVEVGLDGNITYTPNPDFNGVDSFDISVCDPSGGCETLTISVPITGVNDAPIVPTKSFTTNEDTLLVFDPIAGITDPDGDTITMTGFDAASTAGGTITQGSLQYQPPANYVGPDSFTYTISDGTVSINVPVSVAVTDVNDLPTGAPASLNPIEDQTVVFDLAGAFTDPDGDPVTVSAFVVNPPTAGTFSENAGVITFDPIDNFDGSVTINYTVSDGIDPIPSTLTIAFTPVDDLPVINDDVMGVVLTPVTINVLLNDFDVEGLDVGSLVVSTPPVAGTAVVAAGKIDYTPPVVPVTETFEYTVCDTGGNCDTATVTVSITAPSPVADTATADEAGPGVSIDVLANDSGSIDPLTLALTPTDPPVGVVSVDTVVHELDYIPDTNFFGADTFTYQVCDSGGTCVESLVTMTVNPVNDAPIVGFNTTPSNLIELSPGSYTVPEDSGMVIETGFLDPLSVGPAEGPVQTIAAISTSGYDPSLFTTTPAVTTNGDLLFQFAPDKVGSTTVTVTVVDDGDTGHFADTDTTVVTFDLAATPVNDAPLAVADTGYTVAEDAVLDTAVSGDPVVLANDTDVDVPADTLTAVLDAGPSNASSFTLNSDGTFTYTHDGSETTTDSFTYFANDGTVDSATSVTVSIAITPANDAPLAVADTGYTVAEGATLDTGVSGDPSVVANDTDVDVPADILTAVLDSGPVNASSFTLNSDGTFTYTHDGSETTTDSFTYFANDGTVDSATSVTVSIAITPANDAPLAVADTGYTVAEGATLDTGVSGDPSVVANDTDVDVPADILTAVLDSGPVNASSFTLNSDGTFTYTHDGSETTTDSFTYFANDGTVDSATSVTVSIAITPANDAPLAVADTGYTVAEGATLDTGVSGDPVVLANDTDVDVPADTLTAVLDAGPSNASSFTLNSDGTFTYTHDGSETTTDSFTYFANDGTVDSATSVTVSIAITPANDAPLAVADTGYTVAEGATLDTGVSGDPSVVANDTDVDVPADILTAVLDSGPVNASSFTLNSDGTFTYTHDGSETTTDSFTYFANDGTVDSATSVTVSIAITPANDAPLAVADTGYTVAEGATLDTGVSGDPSVVANDTDVDVPADILTAVLDSGPVNASSFTLNSDGTFTYTHDGSETTTDSFTYFANDGTVDSATSVTVSISVTAVNDTPTVVAQSFGLNEGATYNGVVGELLVGSNDPESVPLTAAKSTDPSNGSVTVNLDGSFTYTHDGSETVSDSFTYTASDGVNTSLPATVTITVTPVNDAPIVGIGQSFGIDESDPNGTIVGTVAASDVDSPITGFSVAAGDPAGVFAIDSAGQITIFDNATLDAITIPSYSLQVTATDGIDTSASEIVTVNVSRTNTAPVFSAASYSFIINPVAPVGSIVGVAPAFDADPDPDILGYSTTAQYPGGSFAIDGFGVIRTTALLPDPVVVVPPWTIDLLVDDGNGGTDTATASITAISKTADLGLSLAGGPSVVIATPFTLDYTVTNFGPDQTTGAKVNVYYSTADLDWVAGASSPGCSESPPGEIQCSYGNIFPSTSLIKSLVFESIVMGSIDIDSEVVTASSYDPDPFNSFAPITITSNPTTLGIDLGLEVDSASPGTVGTNTDVRFDWQVTNFGGTDAPAGSVLTATLPAGVSFSSGNPSCVYSAPTVSCTVASAIPSGQSVSNSMFLQSATLGIKNVTFTITPVDALPGNNTVVRGFTVF